ncbi:hypothetical protein J2W42_000446 [Rhizobium tibeticum]|uniref:Uncharacterized protein n=1 Tax=Rhizobium tibeticum TaxID=501024 RepID=A0A1H8SRD3_9HYPH|nr:hypothetical protein [Rhizobium tibeticum]MDP9807615.1 hypothetical protein [Rhizobium tibeticum]SEI13903.1 hypothetical protein RTCCBAU85039_5005 [Rhizobium tibeticum]SEO81519.1 hypothetical protein SAMN05216228_10269 [Rhizobium tibeticum]
MQEVENVDAQIGKSEFMIKPGSLLAVTIFEAEKIAGELVRRANIDAADASRALHLIALLNRKLHLGCWHDAEIESGLGGLQGGKMDWTLFQKT